MRNVSDKTCKENQNTIFHSITFFPLKSCCLWDNVEKCCRARHAIQMTIWCICIACWITKATNTHSEYVILIALPWQQWFCERASNVMFICTLSILLVSVNKFLGQEYFRQKICTTLSCTHQQSCYKHPIYMAVNYVLQYEASTSLSVNINTYHSVF